MLRRERFVRDCCASRGLHFGALALAAVATIAFPSARATAASAHPPATRAATAAAPPVTASASSTASPAAPAAKAADPLASTFAATRFAPAKGKATNVAILDFTPQGVPPEVAENVAAVVAVEVARYDDLRPITRREIASVLGFDRERQLLECRDDSCLVQLIGGLGLSKILSGQVGRLDNEYVLTLNLIDATSARVEARASRTAPVEGGKLVAAVKSAVTDLMRLHTASRNQPPRLATPAHLVATAGDRVVLDASRCYDPDGDPLEISWRQVDGPPAPLEGAQQTQAAFVPSEPGTYAFAVQATDGRSSPQQQRIEVEVRQRRRFMFGLGGQALGAFNRLVEADAAGNYFRNRAPVGGLAFAGLRLSERWLLTADLSYSYMHVYPEDESLESHEYLNATEYGALLSGVFRFPFDGFALGISGGAGPARVLYTAKQGTALMNNVRSNALLADLSATLDLPVGERFGLFLKGGMRVRVGTEWVAPFKGIDFELENDGFLSGLGGAAIAYFRL